MGGALAQITMMQLLSRLEDGAWQPQPPASNLIRNASCITFGSPMAFAPAEEVTLDLNTVCAQRRALRWMADRCVNYVNNNDLVARLPGVLPFLREVLQTVRPSRLAYHFGARMLTGAPVIRKYRPIACVSMIGHTELVTGHKRLGIQPWDPECARALCTRQPIDNTFETAKGVANWVSGGIVNCIKDHMLPRYESYLLAAFGIQEAPPTVPRRRFQALPIAPKVNRSVTHAWTGALKMHRGRTLYQPDTERWRRPKTAMSFTVATTTATV